MDFRRGLPYHTALLIILLAVCTVGAANICQGKPADVFFILDSSGSISSLDFARQLEFVKGVVDVFDMSPNMTQVGALSFSNWAFIEFHLDAFHTRDEVKQAIDQIQQIHGDTNTAAALAFMREVAFTPGHGARPETPQIAVVLTDGKSNKPWQTAQEAFKAQMKGIHVFAIGIGNEIDMEELRRIASSPDAQHVFHVSSYSALTSIRQLLAIETCKVTVPPTTLAPSTTQTPAPKRGCGVAELADIILGPSPTSNAPNTVKTLDFFRDLSSTFNIDDGLVRVGLVPKDCSKSEHLTKHEFTDRNTLVRQLENTHKSHKESVSVLRHIRKKSFLPQNGGRPEAKKMAVVVIDENDEENILYVMREAFRMKTQLDVELFFVGVGKGIRRTDLEAMASPPGDSHVILVDDYDQLSSKVEELRQLLCPKEST